MWTDAGGLELGWRRGHVVNISLWRMEAWILWSSEEGEC